MSKVYISLVGGQPMPVYVGIEATKPDSVILIHSEQSKNDALNIQSQCGLPTSLFEFPAVDYPDILKRAEELLDSYSDSYLFINISSGTKLWSIAFSLLSEGRENVAILYVDQNMTIHDLTHKNKEVASSISIDTILLSHNQRGYAYNRLDEYTEWDWRDHWKIRQLRSVNYGDFNKLAAVMDKDFQRKLEDPRETSVSSLLPSGSFVSYDKISNTMEFSIVNRHAPFHISLNSPHICNMTFNSGWFEFEVAKMFEGWRHAKEIWMNVSFPASNNISKNEIDIIINLGHRLLFIECKTQLSKITDIDKFHNAVNNYGGTGSLAVFVTDERLSAAADEKCKESNVLAFSFKSIYGRGRFNQKTWDVCRMKLLQYLEQNMNVINKK